MNLHSLMEKKISDYDIEMLNVKAADAFILRYMYEGDERYHIILVDAGNVSDGDNILEHIKKYNVEPVIDLAIVTHPDKDHFGGFIPMLKHIKANDDKKIKIKKFWINNPQNYHIDVTNVKYIRTQNGVNERAASIWDHSDDNLVQLIEDCKIPMREKFAETDWETQSEPFKILVHPVRSFDEFPGCTIIGPTKKYFEELAPNMRFDNMVMFSEVKENDEDEDDFVVTDDCLSYALDNASDDDSAHNQSSLIFLWEPQAGKKYLFMGDAGYAAFNKLKLTHKKLVQNVTWLKVPHHGSMHNLNSEMIRYFSPKTAYISTEKRGHYLSQCTVNALKNAGVDVYSTHLENSNILRGHREGYSPAKKM